MTLKRLLLAAAVLAGLASAAWWGRQGDWAGTANALEDPARTAGQKMASAATRFVGLLTDEQRGKALFAFDDPERTDWNFVPLQKDKKPLRKGLRLDEMTDAEKAAAKDLLRTGASDDGYTKAVTIMSLENVLRELEQNGANVRNPEWYFVTVFGKPSDGKWGWRVEGHHLSLNFTLDGGKVIGSTPNFYGANPAEVREGDRKGLRTLPEAEDYAKELFASLDDDGRKAAFQPKQFPEIEQAKPKPNVGAPVGLAGSRMNERQRNLLLKLVRAYADRMPPDVAAEQMGRVREAGVDAIHFAFCREDDKPGKPYTYRVQGPTFVIEFLDVQEDGAKNPANHIHSCWRNLPGDFGLETK